MEFKDVVEAFQKFDLFGNLLQDEISEALTQDPDVKRKIEMFSNLPENEQVDFIKKIASSFVMAMPYANSIGVNLLTTTASFHSPLTETDTVNALIDYLNEKTNESKSI